MKTWLVLLCLLALTVTAKAELLGHSLKDAKKSDFFKLLTFQEQPEKNADWHEFRTKSVELRELLCVRVKTRGRSIEVLDLEINRAFVDAPEHNEVARDVCRSFLLESLPDDDQEHYRHLVMAIWKGLFPTSPGYDVFLGRSVNWKDLGQACRLELNNDKSSLHLIISRR